MPLDADHEALRRILDALERPVGCPVRPDAAVSAATGSLVVVRGHLRCGTDEPSKSRILFHFHRVDGELPGNLLVVVVPDRFGEVLDEVSPARDVQELESATD